jgi:hypothetical protein
MGQPLGAVFAPIRPQHQKRKQHRRFDETATMRAPDIHAPAEWATSEETKATMWHVTNFEAGMLPRP